MKRGLFAYICIAVLLFVGCNVQNDPVVTDDFVSEIYNEPEYRAPMRIECFSSLNNDAIVTTENVNYHNPKSIVDNVLAALNKYFSVEVFCYDCIEINQIVFVNLSQSFLVLSDADKACVIASVVSTFAQYDAEYMMLYSMGTAIRLDKAKDVFLSPFALGNSIAPRKIYVDAISSNEMLNKNDDFVLPIVLWREEEGLNVPRIESVPMNGSYIDSIIKYLFDNERALIGGEHLFDLPVVTADNITVETFNFELSSELAHAIKNNFRQFYGTINSVTVKRYVGASKAYATFLKNDEFVMNEDRFGEFVDIYQPENNNFVSKTAVIPIIDNDRHYSVADYCIKNSLNLVGGEKIQDVLLYDVWFAQDNICISISEKCKQIIQGLSDDHQRSVIYSLVNTLCRNFDVSQVLFLLDGYTVKNIGVLNTERPLKIIGY